MSSNVIKMQGQSKESIEKLLEILNNETNGELVSYEIKTVSDCKIGLIVLEKFYMRTSSYANLTVLITEHNGQQTADIIASAGGGGIFNISWGSNKSFASIAEEVLEENGFTRIE